MLIATGRCASSAVMSGLQESWVPLQSPADQGTFMAIIDRNEESMRSEQIDEEFGQA